MTIKNWINPIKLYLLFFIFFMLDLIRPFYFIHTESLFLGVVFCALNCPLRSSISLAAVFGLLKDIYLQNNFLYNVFIFIAVVLLIQFICRRLHHNFLLVNLSFVISSLSYIIFNFLLVNTFNLRFALVFFFDSWLFFLAYQYFILKWIPELSKEQ